MKYVGVSLGLVPGMTQFQHWKQGNSHTQCNSQGSTDMSSLMNLHPILWSNIYKRVHQRMCLRLMALNTRQRVDWLLGTEPLNDAYKWEALQVVIVRGLETMMRCRGRLF